MRSEREQGIPVLREKKERNMQECRDREYKACLNI
jgi:hypothetical protein